MLKKIPNLNSMPRSDAKALEITLSQSKMPLCPIIHDRIDTANTAGAYPLSKALSAKGVAIMKYIYMGKIPICFDAVVRAADARGKKTGS